MFNSASFSVKRTATSNSCMKIKFVSPCTKDGTFRSPSSLILYNCENIDWPPQSEVHECDQCHQMETFSALLALCEGNSPVTGEFPSQRPVARSCDIFFDLCLNKLLNNHRDANDLRRHRAHYNVIVMSLKKHMMTSWHGHSFRITSHLLLAWTSCWTNNRIVSDVRHHGAQVISTEEYCSIANVYSGMKKVTYWWYFLFYTDIDSL